MGKWAIRRIATPEVLKIRWLRTHVESMLKAPSIMHHGRDRVMASGSRLFHRDDPQRHILYQEQNISREPRDCTIVPNRIQSVQGVGIGLIGPSLDQEYENMI